MFGKRKKKLEIETVVLDDIVAKEGTADVTEDSTDEEAGSSIESNMDNSNTELGNNEVEEEKEVAVESSFDTSGENDTEHSDKKKRLLYIVSDRVSRKFKEYVNDTGLMVEDIFSELSSARDSMLLQFEDYRMVIVDTGTGKFTSVTARKELIDMIGIMDEQTSVSIFYTDEALKSEAKAQLGKKYKDIHWCKFDGTPKMVAEIMKIDEEYIGMEHKIVDIDKEIENRFIGDKVLTPTGADKFRYRRELISTSVISENTLVDNGEDGEELVRTYNEVI